MMDEIMICTFTGGCRGSGALVEDCRVNFVIPHLYRITKIMYIRTYTYTVYVCAIYVAKGIFIYSIRAML